MRDTIIKSVKATEVIVPSKKGSLNSPSIIDKDAEFAKKFLTGKSWTGFADQSKWIVEIELVNGVVGIGETYRSASKELVWESMNRFVGLDARKINWRRLPVPDQRIYESFETAILDVCGKTFDVPVYQLLGGMYRDKIECNGWTGRRTPEEAAQKAFEALKNGHKVFKFKCSYEDPVRLWTEEIRKKCNGEIKIMLDPNQRWKDVNTTLKLMDGVDKDIMFGLEDPIVHEDVEGFKFLRKTLGIPLYRHISLPYSQDIKDIITFVKADAVDGYNFNGSAFNSVLLAEISYLEGKQCWRGSEVDLGISETMALHIAAASINCTIPCDIFGELVREDDLIESPIEFDNGAAMVPKKAGLGVALDRAALAKYGLGNLAVVA